MKNKEILANSKVGCIITNKQILSALKRKGLIADYSPWGYLESNQVCYKDEWKGEVTIDWDYIELFPNGTANKCIDITFKSRDEMMDKVGYGRIQYMGCEFDTKYLDGCFKPYLQLVAKEEDNTQVVNPRMSVFGAIV